MRTFFLRATFLGLVLTVGPVRAQMHKVAKPEQVVRAIGVYEWTGDLTKPKASRLIPVSIFINSKLEDAGVYVARPVPFALLTGNVYELQNAGIDKALLDLAYSRHMQAVDASGDSAWDDGWFGYGNVKLVTAPRKTVALKPSKTQPVLTSSKGAVASTADGRPHLQAKTGDTTSSGTDQSKPASSAGTTSASSSDPDRPTMKRRNSDTDDTNSTASSKPAASSTGTSSDSSASKSSSDSSQSSSNDPDRPTMKRRSDSSADSTTTTASTTTPSKPADDPDRPTMKRRSDSDSTTTSSTGTGTSGTDTASTKSSGSTPADDPDRPTMKRRSSDSTPTDSTTDSTTSTASTEGSTPAGDPDRPTLKRHSPEDVKRKNGGDQASVSGVGSLNDDPTRPTLHHGKPTSAMTETDLPKLVGMPTDLHQMVAVSDAVNRDPHEFALSWDDEAQHAAILQKMQTMARAQLAAYGAPKAPATPVPAKPSVAKTTPTAKSHRATAAPAAAPEPLLDEELKAYTLSYGGAATYVYSAHTAGTGAALRYVTIVVQADGLGELKPAIQNVTDAAHLDRTPRMRFVDAVDAEASNRASLLFELRSQNSRQFGLYRVIAARSEQTFLTGSTQ